VHDGALELFSRAVREVLNNTHHDRWIGRGGPTAWPILILWIFTLVYASHFDNEEARHHRIVKACQTNPSYPGVLERMRRFIVRRVETCIESHGVNFEYLL
jgi:hypothetical protein